MKRYVICITGASGAQIAVTLLGHLDGERHLVISKEGEKLLRHECGLGPKDLMDKRTKLYSNDDMGAAIASGSCLWDACVVVPCSMTTLARVSTGLSDTLISRVASIALKERRRLILVPREAPLSDIHLTNMLEASRAGAIVLPAMMTFYTKPGSIQDMVDVIVGRILDLLGVPHKMFLRWGEGSAARKAGR
jgi:4-hydroxy-3-polyprenylbenzoate decarboxylase